MNPRHAVECVVVLLAAGCFLLALALLAVASGPRVDDNLAEIDPDEPIGLVPADDVMAVADAVQDPEVPEFIREHMERVDLALWELSLPVELQDEALRPDSGCGS